ncbi:unnamed protein product [Ilex paraguariensis]|uniref:Uncharacterized protein n=1 Tax=Ilex paraguariensis TaxID=185542 RepID=A0ABC8V125_9AQUA
MMLNLLELTKGNDGRKTKELPKVKELVTGAQFMVKNMTQMSWSVLVDQHQRIRRRNNGSQYEPTIVSTKSVKKPSASTSIQSGWRAPSASTSIQSSWRAPSASISIQSAWRAPSASTSIQFAWRAPSASQKSTWNTPSNASKSS